jgi:hypothetical protein
MDMKSEKSEKPKDEIVVEIPAKAIHIEHATCHRGCNLMAPDVKIHSHPAIKVMAKYEDQQGPLYLDPVYGSFDNVSELAIPEGAVAEFFCPTCGDSLAGMGETCNSCSAPLFVLKLPRGSLVEGCLRKGCHKHRLKIVDLDAQLLRRYEKDTLESYL